MKALLIKDYYNFRFQYFNIKSLAIMAIIYLVMVFTSGFEVGISYLSTISYILLLFSFRLDSQSGAISYAKGLPVSTEKLVLSKYLSSAIVSGILFVIYCFFFFIFRPFGLVENPDIVENIGNFFLMAMGVFLVNVMILPFVFKFGARTSLVFVFFIVIGILAGIVTASQTILEEFFGLSQALQAGIILGAVLLIFLISYVVSLRIVKNK